MKKHLQFTGSYIVYCTFFFLSTAHSFAQIAWTQKANFTGTGRYAAAGFSIGAKGYIGTGTDNVLGSPKKDFWEWSQATNTWTQKADFSGAARENAVGFSIGAKAYIGTGKNGSAYYDDFLEYDPVANAWTPKANFGGTARSGAAGFSIGAKAYIGTGNDGALKKDFWEWDQSANVWTQKADFSGTARENAVGFSIGAKGYIGTGKNGGSYYDDFWEYDPAANAWAPKANFGGAARAQSAGFSSGTKGYIATGSNGVNGNTYYNDFWQYDPVADTWTQKADVGLAGRKMAVGFSIGGTVYFGTGLRFLGSPQYFNDLWEWDPCAAFTGNISSQTNVSCNGGNNGSVTFTAGGGTPPYAYLWSNGQTTSTAVNLPTGTYMVTVTEYNGCTMTGITFITQPVSPPAISTSSFTIVNESSCGANDGSASANVSGGTPPYSYSWSNGQSAASATGLAQGSYTLTVTDANGCTLIAVAGISCPTAVVPYSSRNEFVVYPNPTSGKINLSMRQFEDLKMKDIEIHTILGEKIYSLADFQINSSSPQGVLGTNFQIDLSSQPNGIYFIRINTGPSANPEAATVQKIIIQK
ncbi:MAG: T9SS type A sorting domain-containing protein [Bacteroidetes bacterium]|nr:MAG: T9SS type A sorting domain-containing protein [Bacteroidota bacterium]